MVNTPKPRPDRLWWEIGQLPGANGVAEFSLQVRVAFSDVRFRGCSISLCLAGARTYDFSRLAGKASIRR